MAKVTLWPSGEVVEIDPNKTLLDNLKEQGIMIQSTCGGFARCGDCGIKVLAGGKGLSTQEHKELSILGNTYYLTQERLCCQTKLLSGDVTIDISRHPGRVEKKKEAPPQTVLRSKQEKDDKIQERQTKFQEKMDEHEKLKGTKGGHRRPKPFKTN